MRRRFLIWILMTCWVLNSFAQGFGTHWISCPAADDSSQVMFCRSYCFNSLPRRAFLSFGTSGAVKVYVNGRNVSGSMFFANGQLGVVTLHTYDVTRYLMVGNNVIAVWFAPHRSMPIGKQLSLQFFGTDAGGTPFLYAADKTWRCKKPIGCMAFIDEARPDSILETFSYEDYGSEWKMEDHEHDSWQHACTWYGEEEQGLVTSLPSFPVRETKLQNILLPVAETEDSLGVHYFFQRPFRGMVRVTLRDASKGERILVDRMAYTCSGKTDEQLFRRFSTSWIYEITILGDKSFRKSQIQKVEGLEISGVAP